MRSLHSLVCTRSTRFLLAPCALPACFALAAGAVARSINAKRGTGSATPRAGFLRCRARRLAASALRSTALATPSLLGVRGARSVSSIVPVARPLVKARASKRLRRPCFSSCYALGVARSCSLFKISRRIPRALLVPAPGRRGRFRPRPKLGLCRKGSRLLRSRPTQALACSAVPAAKGGNPPRGVASISRITTFNEKTPIPPSFSPPSRPPASGGRRKVPVKRRARRLFPCWALNCTASSRKGLTPRLYNPPLVWIIQNIFNFV